MQKNKTNYIETIKPSTFAPSKIITFDIETLLKDNIHIPYLYSMFDGINVFSWFTQSPDLLFKELFKRKYYGFQIYAHNLSKFDVVFFFKYLGYLSFTYKVRIWRREGKIIMIRITNRKDHISLTIKDSLLLLPASLDKLSKNFNIENPKLIEPVLVKDITNSEGSGFYIMDNPSHYSKEILKLDNYLIWKDLVQKYCETDCISLHQILNKFRSLVYENFELLIDNYPTTPSLAFGIFRSRYLNKETISILNNEEDTFIRKSFTGGSTDAIIPYGENIFVYDVNSLYPSMMANNLFPVGGAKKFESLNEIPENSYWFAEVEVSTKKDLVIPYLQIHHNNRTISPNGSFKMVINSIEYFNALKDYHFKILGGYFFKQDNLFFRFVNDLYNLRLTYSKSDPMNLIAKLLMNSLFGRFGMKTTINTSFFVKDLSDNFVLDEGTISIDNLADDLFLGSLIVSSLKNLGKFLFFSWEVTSMIGLCSFTIAMLAVAFDFSDFVIGYIAMAVPLLPESMLVFSLPFLIDMGFYTPDESWFQWINSYLISGYHNTLNCISYIYIKSYNCIYFIVVSPYYLIYYLVYYPIKLFSLTVSYITGFAVWCWGIITILIGIKLWALWTVISDEANTIMLNLNLINPIPAYIMAMLYHGLIRPGQMVMSTGATFFIDYFQLLLPSWNDCYDLLSWVVTGRGRILGIFA